VERKYSKEALEFSDEIAGRRGGGMGRGRPFDSRGFGPPKSHTGDTAPKLNRAGKSTAPVEKLKSPSREFIDALSDKARLELQHKLLPRTSPDYKGPPGPQSRASQTMAEREAAHKAANQARSHEFPRYRDPSKFGKQVQKEVAKKHGYDMDVWKKQNLPARGFAKGGMVKSTRDYGK